jgi:2-keto-3-deoxy-L-rhamnonate aldolase RhmA
MAKDFGLVLFACEDSFVREAIAAGVDGVLVDWERIGKSDRQSDADTEINGGTVEDLRRMRALGQAPVSCRINGVGPTTAAEIEQAVAAGANEIFVPMVRAPGEVETVLRAVEERCSVSILVETRDALTHLAALSNLPIARVYVGLNDLAIERRSRNLFEPLVDGTLDTVRHHVSQPLGLGGLTLPDRGDPIPCRLLIGEMARLACGFCFLRRSFRRDVSFAELPRAVPAIRAALDAATRRSPREIQRDRSALVRAVRTSAFPPAPAERRTHATL